MEGRRSALLIGVNQCGHNAGMPRLRYAERDAEAIYNILVDQTVGTFDARDASLLVGEQATCRELKARLRTLALPSRPADVLLVYFAGHALAPDWSRESDVYLGTADLDVDDLRNDPDAGLRLGFLKRDVFELFAGTSFLVLDCCHAGAYAAADAPQPGMLGGRFPQIDRHSALLSCRSEETARESAEFRHGLLTHHLLRALRGAAADDGGRVSFAGMANYVTSQRINPTPGYVANVWGTTTVLTQPHASRDGRQRPLTQPTSPARAVVCENPMDRCASSILQLLDRLFRGGGPVPRQRIASTGVGRVERIRDALQADAVGVVEFGEGGVTKTDATPRFDVDGLGPLLDQSRHQVFPAQRGTLGHVCSDDDGRRMLCVPLCHDDRRTLALAVLNPATSALDIGEPLATVLRALWDTDLADDPLQTEVLVLTALRSTFGRLPLSVYEHCFSRYRQLIGSLEMVFQPVVAIHPEPRLVSVHSYEALARRHHGDTRAPARVLQAADAWGDRFLIERDAALLRTAVTSYAAADREGPWDAPKPIAINVSVRSLLSDVYRAMLRDTLRSVALDQRAVTLEISEQDPIQPAPDEQWPMEPLAYFHERLTTLARDLEISFAVDDFGVGYASLARMAELPLTQIKVDRAVLHHPLALDELELVVRVARYSWERGHVPTGRAVVVEGLDRESPVTPHELFERKIRYVQGYITEEPPAPTLRPISEDVRNRIAALTRGEDVQCHTDAAARGDRGAAAAA